MENFAELLKNGTLEGLSMRVKVGNPDFVQSITLVKYMIIIISLVCLGVYARQLKHVPINLRVVEQDLILRQSVLLIFFNDPFIAAIFYSPNSA